MTSPPSRSVRGVIALALAGSLAAVALTSCGGSSSPEPQTTSTAAKAKLRKAVRQSDLYTYQMKSSYCLGPGRYTPECANENDPIPPEGEPDIVDLDSP